MESSSQLNLSSAQAGMWFAQQLDPDNPAFVTGQCIEISGPVDAATLARAVDLVVAQSPELRTRIAVADGTVQQVPGGAVVPPTPVVTSDGMDAALAGMRSRLRESIDLVSQPGYGATVYVLGDGHLALFHFAHHALLDVYGYSLLGRRIATVYNALAAGAEPPAPRFDPVSKVLDGDRTYAESGLADADRDFWLSELRGAPDAISPAAEPAPPASAIARELRSRTLTASAEAGDRLDGIGRAAGGGWADAVTAVVAGYLARVTGELDVTLGFPAMNRMGTAAAKVLTTAVNVVPLRLAIDPAADVAALTVTVRAAVARTAPHARFRAEDVHRALHLPATAAGPVGPTVNVKPFGDTLRFAGATATVHSLARGPVNDIAFVVRRLDDTREVEIQIDADADRYTDADLDAHVAGLGRVLDAATADGPALAQVKLLTEDAERDLAAWAGTVAPDDSPDVLVRFDEQVAARPDAPALVAGGERLTYRELADRVDALAADLRGRGAAPESLVALALPRTADVVVALLAVLRTGAGYVPLDPQFPTSRLDYMLADARPTVLLTTPGFTDRVAVPDGTAVATVVNGVVSWGGSSAGTGPSGGGIVDAAATAYVIYTSGSTGNPKGVVLDRRALARFVAAAADVSRIGSGTRLLAVTTLSFDIAVLELFVPLCEGGTVVLADEDAARDPAVLAALIASESVTAMQATPSLWGAVLEHPAVDLTSVAVLVGGEALPAPVAAGLSSRAPSVTNMYGPTEATVWCTSAPVPADRDWSGSIGTPFPGTAAVVLDRFLQPAPAGVVGELYIAGPQLARGYRGRPDLTAARFVADPGGRGRLYRTGDLARWSADGTLDYLGRGDDQVKVRGHRIELGEIETVAAGHETVSAAVAVARPDATGTLHLVGYVVAAEGTTVDITALRDHLAAVLPAYMVPSALVVLDEFPLTPNLKVDRKSLPDPDFGGVDTGRRAETDVEGAVAAAFADLLGVDDPGVDADFFTLGGTSLSATRLLARIAGVLGVTLSLRDVFDAPTVAGLAAVVDAASPSLPAVTPVPRTATMPLSAAQQRLWFLHRANGPSATYNVPFALRISGRVDEAALHRALAAVVARHEVLRSVVVDADGIGVARILPADTAVPTTVADIAEGDLDAVLRDAARTPFDLTAEIPIRAHLLRTTPDAAVLLLVIHHLAGDEWSAGPLLGDLATVYSGGELPDDAGRIQYADYATWQVSQAEPAAALNFWRTALAGAPEELALPRDRARRAVPTQRGDDVWLHLDAEVIDGLRARTATTGTSMFMAAQTAVAILLARIGAGDDIVLGAPVAGRGAGGVEDVVGLFVDTLALRVDLSGDPTVSEVLERVRRADLDAFAHQSAQFEDVVDAAGVTRSLSRHPLFQTLVQHRTPHVAPGFAGLDVEPSYLSTGTAKFDLTFEFVELPDGLDVRIEYALDLFDRETADALAQRLRSVLAAVAATDDPSAHAVDVLLPAEQAALAAPVHQAASGPLLPDLLAAADDDFADRVALVADGADLTYRDLGDRVNRLARVLVDRGVGPDNIVAVAATRTAATVVALRAVIAAGAAYLPVDPSYPPARIEHMLTDAAPVLILTDAETVDVLGSVGSVARTVLIADLEAEAQVRSSDRITAAERTCVLRGANLAYVVYTSGSTGTPKGVPGTVAALTNRLEWQRNLPIAGDVRLAKSSLSFIDGSTELLAGLLSGARLVLADDAAAKDPAALAALVATHTVTQVTAVPSLAAVLADAGARVPTWFLSGEPLEPRVIAGLTDVDPVAEVTVYNSYGSSEVAGDVNVWAAAAGSPVLIGSAVPGVAEYILDAHLRPVPDGVVGELYVGGVQLARGYLGRPGLTVARFVANPFGAGRLFRTGDLVRRTRAGELAFVSRADNQMSLHGFRIEPGEVEAALTAHPGVERSLVMVRAGASGADQFVGYVTADAELTGDDLRMHLRDLLPDYMIPAAFVILGEFPSLPNGKVDRDALPAPSRDAARREPATDAEREICAAVADLLTLDEVGPDEDFFALGGNSLLATRLSFALRSRLGREVGIREIFDLRTPARLALASGTAGTRVPLVRAEHEDLVPMSAAQGRLWFLFQLEGASPTYNIPFTMRLRGRVDVDALRGALAHLIGAHESLRTVFAPGDDGHIGYQRVLGAAEREVPLTVADVAAADLDARLVEATGYAFDITSELPLRATLLRTAADDAHLMLLVHHIAADEWSARPLIADLAAAYSHLAGSDVALPQPLPVQYRDFSVWQPQVLGDPADPGSPVAVQLDHWTAALAGQPDELTLPRDRPRPAVAGYRGSAVGFTLGSGFARSLAAVAADSGATMFMLTHAAVAVLLRELGAGDDIVVGSPVAGRSDAALERVVGFFVNTLVLRTDLSGDPTFGEVLHRVRASDLDAYAHQDVPFEVLVERMAPARSLSRQPLFQVLVQYRDPIDPVAMTGLDVTPVFVETGTSKFDLTFELAAADDGAIRGRIEYASDLFDHETVEAFADRLIALLEQVAARPDSALSALDPLTAADRDALAAAESGVAAVVDATTLPELFTRQAAATPDALALVVDETGQEWTYAQLDRAVDALAGQLSGAAGGVVAVAVRRSAALVVSLLAIHRAGAAYLPLDDSYPADRLAYMVADAQPAVLLRGPDVPRIETDATVVDIDSDGAVLDGPTVPGDRVSAHPDSAAYLLYTSGSTGRPKGVVVSHRAIVNRLAWMQDEYSLTAADRVLQKTPSGFDVSVWEFFWPLITGATLVVARPDGHRDPRYLREVIERRGVTTAHFVPSMLAAFLDDVAEAGARPVLDRVLCSGEALTTEHRDRFHALVDAPLFNLYGPTEAAVDVTSTAVTEWAGDGPGWVPIGVPVWNTRVLVLDERLRRVPPGVVGELYLGGVQLARGYHGRAALTADRFVADPHGEPGERLYRTGDLVRWRRATAGAGLALDYLGRADGQVKLRGQRVELGEIESVLAGHPAVAQSAALVRSGRIDAYLVPAPGQTVAVPELLAFAAQTLPEHMLPTAVVVLDAFPLSANGKLDRTALPEPAAPEAEERRAPEGPRESALCELYAEALRLDEVGADDDFFLLGGDSIISIQVVNAAARRGITFGPREIFQWRTPAALARVAEFADAAESDGADAGPRDPEESGAVPLTALVHRARESGREPAGIGAAVTVDTEPGVSLTQVQSAVDALVATHDALRLRLTRVASVLWSLETHAASQVPVVHVDADGDPAHQRADVERATVASLDPEAGPVAAATWIDGGDRSGEVVLAVHAFAADSRSLAVLADDLRSLLRGDRPTRPAATAFGLAHRLNDRAQDPALMAELAHWSQVLAPGGSLRVGVPALPALVPDRGRVVVDAAIGDPGADREVVVLAAVAAAVGQWRSAQADLTVEVRRDAPAAADGNPDDTRTAGPFEVGVPVRVADGELATARAALAAAPASLGYGMLRYLGAQTAPVFAALARPEVSVRTTDDGAPEQAVVDPRPVDVTVRFGDGVAIVRVDHDAAQVAEVDARAIAEGMSEVLVALDRAGLSTV